MGNRLPNANIIFFFTVWKTRARVTPRADKALTPDIFYD